MSLFNPSKKGSTRVVLGALAFAELGTVIPRSGAEYAYFVDSFGPLHKFWGPLPAFLYSWLMVVSYSPST